MGLQGGLDNSAHTRQESPSSPKAKFEINTTNGLCPTVTPET